MNPHTPTRSTVRALALGAILLACGFAAAADVSPVQRTVGLFSYVDTGSDMKPGRSFSGVVIDSTHIATSTWALSQGPDQIGTRANIASEVYVSYYTRGKLVTFPVRVSVTDLKAAVTILTIYDAERAAALKLIAPVQVVPLEVSADARAVGVISPESMTSDQINPHTAPPAIPMKIETATLVGSGDTAFAPVNHPLPPSMIGGGIWNSDGQLLGILTRIDDSLQVADAGAVRVALKGPVAVAPPIRAPTPKDPPVTTDPPPAVVTVAPPKDPATLSDAAAAEMLKNLKPLLDRMRYAKLSLAVDASLLDYVNQDQADLVMERIGGGKFTEALSTLDTIEALTGGTLAEQLNYRRALTLTLMGKYADARAKAQRSAAAADSLVRGRGRALSKVLEDAPDGVAKNGKPLTDSATLGALMRAAANTPDNGSVGTTPATANPVSDELRKSLDTAFQTAKSKQLDNRASFDMIDQQLQVITKRIDAAKATGLEAFAKDVAAYRAQLVRREYERSSAELLTLQQKYQEEFSQLVYRNGPEWATAGYPADIHLAKANALIDNFNTALKHFQAIGQQMAGGEKNTDDSFKPMPALPIAKRIDGR